MRRLEQGQALADDFSLDQLKGDLDGPARQGVSALLERFQGGVHWSLMQVEYSLALVWRSAGKLVPVYEELSRQAIFTSKRRRSPSSWQTLPGEHRHGAVGSDFHTRVEGTRVKHFLGPASLKLYDQRGRVLRLECTVNDVTFFRTTARWNIGRGRRPLSWRRSRKASSACATCAG